MNSNFRNILEKIEVFHIIIFLTVLILVLFCSYQYCAGIPKQCHFDSVEIAEIFPEMDCIIQEINQDKKLISCVIDARFIDEKEYRNYVIGDGVGRKVNFSILLKMENQYYKIKTLQERTENEKVYLVGYVKAKYLKEEFEIFLQDNENQKLYQYTGGENERKN